jgi:biopolymer transport protein ExbD
VPVAKDSAQVETQSRIVVDAAFKDNQLVTTVNAKEYRSVDRLTEALKEGITVSKDKDIQVVIRADRNLRYRYVQEVMKSCQNAGIYKVSFSTIPSEGPTRSAPPSAPQVSR